MAGNFFPLNDAEKKLLSDRYLDLQFEQDVDDFVCVRCDRLTIIHFFTNCGHLLCLNCKRIIDNGGFTCQQCKKIITNASEQRDEFERRLLALRTKCPNTKYGCQVTTNLAQIPVLDKINEHNGQIVELKIGFTKLNEYNAALEEYKEDVKMELRGLRSDINIETREQKEDITQLKNEFRAMKEDMNKMNFEISTMKKEMTSMNNKIKDKEVQLKEKLRNSQLPNTKHPIEEFLKRKSSIDKLLDRFLFGSAKEKAVFESLCFKWNIKNKHLFIPKEGEHEHLSEVFPVYDYLLQAQLKLTVDSGGHINFDLCFANEEREGQEVDIKPLPMIAFIIKDLSRQNRHLIRYCRQFFNNSLQYNEFIYGMTIIKSECNFLISPRDKSMEVLVLVEPPTIINNSMSVEGTITDTIEHYRRKLLMEREGLINGHFSPPFLTHAGGFRVAVEMQLNRPFIGKNKIGLAIFVFFLPGKFDSHLNWKFEHETSFTLINPFDANKNITVNKTAKDINSYLLEIASEDVISSGGFLMSGSLTYHVTIKPIKKKVIN